LFQVHQPIAQAKRYSMKNYPRFILVDDDVCTLFITKQIIRNYCRHAEVIPFSACHEAINYMETDDFIRKDTETVILTDLHMPEIDGFALLDRMESTFRAMKKRVHVFVVSAAACPAEVSKVFSYGYVIGFLNKPFSTAKLKQIIDCIEYPL
jgi:response regulator of citrate/malate metabolism